MGNVHRFAAHPITEVLIMLGFIKGLFGFDSVVNSATKIVDKIAGTDWLPKDKADFIIRFQEATKHQSPARRFIAVVITFVWLVMVCGWLVGTALGLFLGLQSGIQFANAIKVFLSDTITEPFNYVIIFYFTVQILNGIKK